MTFSSLGLRAELSAAVEAKGYTEPTPIQAQSIPAILQGRDLLGGSQTGTGKTAAFTLPVLQLLSEREVRAKGRSPRALVLAPTRELAAQVGESVSDYGKDLSLRSTVIFGGVGINPQISRLRQGVDILVATPGRLLDHAGQKTVDLSRVEILILDEADRMLDMGFIHDIKKVIALLPGNRQNLLFSATYSDEIRKFTSTLLHDPVEVAVARRNETAELITQKIHPVSKNDKRTLLTKLIKDGDWSQVLVFTRTKHGANRLAKQLETDGITAAAIHGNKSQGARTRALAEFKKNTVRVLVATDIAARGLDIKALPHVVNYELPNVPEDYVHRIGRTGRAGSSGAAVSLVCGEERKLLRDIERLLKKSVPVENIEGFAVEEHSEILPPPGRGGGNRGGGRGRNRGRGRGGNGGGGGNTSGGGGQRKRVKRRPRRDDR